MTTTTAYCPACKRPLRVRADAHGECVHARFCACGTKWVVVVHAGAQLVDFYRSMDAAMTRQNRVAQGATTKEAPTA
jgi:hypothetical protein